MTKLYEVEMNSKGMPNFSTAKEVPERKTGKWINMIEKGMCYCNQCGFTQETERAYASLFCAKCGAQMNGGDANV